MSQSINLTKHLDKTLSKIVVGVDSMLEKVKADVDANTPEDTRELLLNTRVIPVVIEGGKIIGRVINDTPYNKYIEYGVSDNRNYHKPKGTVFIPNAQGARMFTKAGDKMKTHITEITNV